MRDLTQGIKYIPLYHKLYKKIPIIGYRRNMKQIIVYETQNTLHDAYAGSLQILLTSNLGGFPVINETVFTDT